MPEEHFDIISYYKNGTRDQKDKHKLWIKLLNDMYDKQKNRIGMAKMYKVLQAANPEPGAYPTKRFIKNYLNQQHDNQVRKQTHSNCNDVIRSVITQRPNQIIMVDYLYFYWESDDMRGDGPIDDDGKDDNTKQSKSNSTEVDRLFAKEKVKYRGAIVAIDVFSKYGYVELIEGNINSEKAWKAMDSILTKANNKFGSFGPVRIIQSDKGSEFMKSPGGDGFKDNLIKIFDYQKDKHRQIQNGRRYARTARELDKYKQYGLTKEKMKEIGKKKRIDYYLKHYYGYEGRSTAQSMVERLNRTLKTMTMRALDNKVTNAWSKLLSTKIIKNYNSNHHSTIKTSPDEVAKMKPNGNGIKEIAELIKERAIRHGDIDQGAYKVNDFVRIKIFKPTKLGPKYTFKGGLANILKDDLLSQGDFDGVFVIHSVQKGQSSNQGSRQTTYRIISNWSHESKIDSLPTGQTKARAGKRIDITSDELIGGTRDGVDKYPKAAYGRNFTKNALSRVPKDDDGFPISENATGYTPETIVGAVGTKGARHAAGGDTMYEVKWKGYDDSYNTNEPIHKLKGLDVFIEYQKKKKKR